MRIIKDLVEQGIAGYVIISATLLYLEIENNISKGLIDREICFINDIRIDIKCVC